MALVWLGLLVAGGRRRRTVAGGLLTGLGGSALLLMKAPVALPVLGGAVALRWLDRALDRRGWLWLLGGLLLGLVPGLAWHLGHGIARGEEALVMWGPQGMARITTAVENHGGGPIVPLVQVLTGGWPWLPLWPFGIALAWGERRSQAGRWTLGLTVLSALLVFPLRTQLPWYSLFLWPPFALACGPVLGTLVLRGGGPALTGWLRWIWLSLGGLLLGAVALSFTPPGAALASTRLLAVPAALGLLSAGLLLTGRAGPGRRLRAVLALGGGWALSLLVLFGSPLWNWELNEQPSIKPAIALAPGTDQAGRGLPLVLPPDDEDGRRPSFIWYLDPSTAPSGEASGSGSKGKFLVITRTEQPDLPPPTSCQLDAVGAEGWKRWLCEGR
jgi:4-amino-4-deoxy-L-arabinose transferase-like glycosyltransferase